MKLLLRRLDDLFDSDGLKNFTTLRRFVENTAHDVGTPLTVLQGYLAALQRRPLPSPEAESLQGAVEETQYIAALLGNLVTAARLEDMDVAPARDRVELNALVERVVARHRPLARERGLELEFATPEHLVHVDAEVTLLEQALGNPVHNAVRHGGEGAHAAFPELLPRAARAGVRVPPHLRRSR